MCLKNLKYFFKEIINSQQREWRRKKKIEDPVIIFLII